MNLTKLDNWILNILADPNSKRSAKIEDFLVVNGVLDARIFLKNTSGFSTWLEGQAAYEIWERRATGYQSQIEKYNAEIDRDRSIYEHIKMEGKILDIGGGAGTVREFLHSAVEFVSIDPYINAIHEIPLAKKQAYKCLSQHINFIGACAEFLPFLEKSFDWVHMRSMIDHVQIPDLCLIEANRVLKDTGKLVVGLLVYGGKSGKPKLVEFAKHTIKEVFATVGFKKYKDHHMFHPTFKNLCKLITDNGFNIVDVYWQPHWKDNVCYITASKFAGGRNQNQVADCVGIRARESE